MTTSAIDAKLLAEMFFAGAANLEANKEWINELNVFPVPDGDTGTNMTLTIKSAVNEVAALGDTGSMADICKAMSSGSLRGARGNSGVILSQLIRGFGKVAKSETELTIPVLADAFDRAVETAYKAVMKPKEGTILTVARTIAEDAVRQAQLAPDDYDALFNVILQSGDAILKRTPEMLPVLKQAGVVDAGGYGLLLIYTGYAAVLRGESIDSIAPREDAAGKAAEFVDDHDALEEVPFAYHTAFTVCRIKDTVQESDIDHFRRRLNRVGDLVHMTVEPDKIKVHLHTNEPGRVLEYGMEIGELTDLSLENLLERRREKIREEEAAAAKEPPKPFGMVSGALGQGFSDILKDLQVDAIVEGGQTMNPSIEDLQKAIDSVNAETIFVFPNNGNVILAANQAAQISDKNVIVIPTKNVAMGIAAAVAFQPDLDAQENAARMEEAAQRVRTGTITYAVRDSEFEDMHICEGDIIGLHNGKVAYRADNVHDVAIELVKAIVTEDDGLITIYYGADTKEEDAQALAGEIGELCPDCDVEVHAGGQPLYYYLIAVE